MSKIKFDLQKINPKIYIVAYFIIGITILSILTKNSPIQLISYIIYLILFYPLYIIIYRCNSKKKAFKKTIIYLLIFSGVFYILNNFLILYISQNNFIQNINIKLNSTKVVDIGHLQIYVNPEKKKVYEFYNNGNFGDKTIKEQYDLIEKKDSELSLRYDTFYTYNENVKFAFPSNTNALSTYYLFDFKFNNKIYEVRSIVPQKDTMKLINKAGFKRAIIFNIASGNKEIYLNMNTKDAILFNNNTAINQPFVDVDYNKNQEFSERYKKYNSVKQKQTIADKTQDLTITMMKTFDNVSKDIQRVTFYNEGTSQLPFYSFVELIFDNHSIVFRTPYINTNNITKVTRSSN